MCNGFSNEQINQVNDVTCNGWNRDFVLHCRRREKCSRYSSGYAWNVSTNASDGEEIPSKLPGNHVAGGEYIIGTDDDVVVAPQFFTGSCRRVCAVAGSRPVRFEQAAAADMCGTGLTEQVEECGHHIERAALAIFAGLNSSARKPCHAEFAGVTAGSPEGHRPDLA